MRCGGPFKERISEARGRRGEGERRREGERGTAGDAKGEADMTRMCRRQMAARNKELRCSREDSIRGRGKSEIDKTGDEGGHKAWKEEVRGRDLWRDEKMGSGLTQR